MTIIIVFVFFVCWTPYQVMSVWYWYDRDSALEVDQRIQKGLFLFACTNSCMNPVVYGVFNIRARRKGTKVPDTSIGPGSVRQQRADVVCLVSWRKCEKSLSVRQRREVCLSCGESFEIPAKEACEMNGK